MCVAAAHPSSEAIVCASIIYYGVYGVIDIMAATTLCVHGKLRNID